MCLYDPQTAATAERAQEIMCCCFGVSEVHSHYTTALWPLPPGPASSVRSSRVAATPAVRSCSFLGASFGFDGSCFQKDISHRVYISEQYSGTALGFSGSCFHKEISNLVYIICGLFSVASLGLGGSCFQKDIYISEFLGDSPGLRWFLLPKGHLEVGIHSCTHCGCLRRAVLHSFLGLRWLLLPEEHLELGVHSRADCGELFAGFSGSCCQKNILSLESIRAHMVENFSLGFGGSCTQKNILNSESICAHMVEIFFGFGGSCFQNMLNLESNRAHIVENFFAGFSGSYSLNLESIRAHIVENSFVGFGGSCAQKNNLNLESIRAQIVESFRVLRRFLLPEEYLEPWSPFARRSWRTLCTLARRRTSPT